MLESADSFELDGSYHGHANCHIQNFGAACLEPRATQDSSIDNRTIIALAVLCGALGLMLVCWTGWYCLFRWMRRTKTPILEEAEELEAWDPKDFVYAEQDWPQEVNELTPSPLPLQNAPYISRPSSRAEHYGQSRWSLSDESLHTTSIHATPLKSEQSNYTADDTSLPLFYPSLQDEYHAERLYDIEDYELQLPELPRRSSKRRRRHRSHRPHTRLPTISEVYAFDFGFPHMPVTTHVHNDDGSQYQHTLRRVDQHLNLTRAMGQELQME